MPALLIGVTGVDTYGMRNPKFRRYLDHVRAAGGVPVPLGRRNLRLPEKLAGMLFAGGEDVDPVYYGQAPHPTYRGNRGRDRAEIALAKQALARHLPILAICRGAQLLNVVLGGTLVQDIPSQVEEPLAHVGGVRHAVTLTPGTRLAGLAGTGTVDFNHYHHQAIDRLAPGLIVSARAADGTVEAWEQAHDSSHSSYLMAVQYHPERDDLQADSLSKRLFGDFLTAARTYRAAPHAADGLVLA